MNKVENATKLCLTSPLLRSYVHTVSKKLVSISLKCFLKNGLTFLATAHLVHFLSCHVLIEYCPMPLPRKSNEQATYYPTLRMEMTSMYMSY